MAARHRAPDVFHRHELVEDPVIEHQREAAGGLGLDGHEALRGRVHLDTLELPSQPLVEHGGIRRERDAPVDQHAEVRPELTQIAQPLPPPLTMAGHALEEDDEPGRHAGEKPEVLPSCQRGRGRDAALPVGDGGYRPTWGVATRSTGGRRLIANPDKSPNRADPLSGRWMVLPSDHPAPRERRPAGKRSQPPFRCEANATGFTGISLSPDVVPEVLTHW